MFRNLIFDWSGTLVDDLSATLEATNAVFAACGLPPMSRGEFRERFRLPYVEFYEELLPGVPIDGLEDLFRRAFADARERVTVLPHAREKLAWCRGRGIRTFVLTSMDAGEFGEQLERFALGGCFEATYAGVIDKRERIGGILDEHRLERGQTAFVGDMTHDIETARHGGVASVAVLTGYTGASVLAEARPDFTVADLKELWELFEAGAPGEEQE